MCDLICDVITCCVRSYNTDKSALILKSRLKTRKNMEIKYIFT